MPGQLNRKRVFREFKETNTDTTETVIFTRMKRVKGLNKKVKYQEQDFIEMRTKNGASKQYKLLDDLAAGFEGCLFKEKNPNFLDQD